MKEVNLKISENKPLTENVYKMTLDGDVSEIKKSGQFINIKIDGLFLRRPISVYDKENGKVTVIYKVVGEGTEKNVGNDCRQRAECSDRARKRV